MAQEISDISVLLQSKEVDRVVVHTGAQLAYLAAWEVIIADFPDQKDIKSEYLGVIPFRQMNHSTFVLNIANFTFLNMRAFSIFSIFTLAQQLVAATSANEPEQSLPEQLFLDLHVQEVITNTSGMEVVEPWASMYVQAINERRFGDAVWARYHIGGDVEDGIIDGTNQTVLEIIEEDAREYRVNEPDHYATALAFYTQTSTTDTHAEVLNLIKRIGDEDISRIEKRKTYGISCSRNYLANSNGCLQLIEHMSQSKAYIGNRRAIYSWGSCYLRVGPYHGSGTDFNYWTAHAVAKLIEDECAYVPPCCNYKKTSGYSPKNGGHRKICLSSKRSGCS